MKKTKCAWKRIVAGIMLVAMVITGIPFTQKMTVEAVEGEGAYVPPMEEDTVLYEENFDEGYSEADYSEWLAKEIFGEGNYALTQGFNTYATLSIEDGALRIQSGSGDTAQFLLASDSVIAEQGVVIECDYTINMDFPNSGKYFTFASKPLQGKTTIMNDIWLSGIWFGNADMYRACLKTGNVWDKPGVSNEGSTYCTANTTFNMKVQVTPTDGIELLAKTPREEAYNVLAHLTTEAMSNYPEIQFGERNDGNVRLITYDGIDITLDNLKVYSGDLVMFHNNFASYPQYDEWLAEQIFGEGNYLLGSADAPAVVSVIDGALTINGGSGENAQTAQFLLSDNAAINEHGVVIECDYMLNSDNGYFAFASKKIETSSFIESNHIWISGIWNDGYRACMRGSAYNYEWRGHTPKGTDYNAVGQLYNLKLVVTPDQKIELYAKTNESQDYGDPIAKLTSDNMKYYPEYNFKAFFDDHIRLLVGANCSVTLDNVKVTKAVAEEVLFQEDFSGYLSAAEHSEQLAKDIFGEGNYKLDQGLNTGSAKLSIANGGLRIEAADGEMAQFLIASDSLIAERGAIIELDYTLNSGSAGYFAFASKPLQGATSVEREAWMTGIWPGSSNNYRACIRCSTTNNAWDKPGVLQNGTTYSTADNTTYNLRLEVTPADGIKLSAKATDAETYEVLAHLSTEAMAEYSNVSFAEYRDGNIRLLIKDKCDITIDNMKVSVPDDDTVEEPLPEGVYFDNDFSATRYTQLANEGLASAIFGADNFNLTQGFNTYATLSIANGGLRIQSGSGDTAQFLLASNPAIAEQGVVIECDYTINTDFPNNDKYFVFTSKPLQGKTTIMNEIWLSGIWFGKTDQYRVALKSSATGNAWVKPGFANAGSTYCTANTTYNMKIEVTPADGIKLSAKLPSTEAYDVLAHLTTDEMAKYPDAKFVDLNDGNVRLVTYDGIDITLDNLKVYAPAGSTLAMTSDEVQGAESLSEQEEPKYLFNNNFDSYKSYAESVAEQMVGVDNYIIGEGSTLAGNATIAVEDEALRIVGDDNTTAISRTQLVIANDDRIAERGVIVECDYIMNGGENAFTFSSKPMAVNNTEQNGNWIAGIWTTGHAASLRKAPDYTGWLRNDITTDATYSQPGSIYNLRLEVTPQGYVKFYAKADAAEEYTLLARIQKHQIKGGINYRDCLDNYVRLIVQCKCDVTIDNLKVKLAPVPYDANYDEQVTIQDIIRMKKAITDETVYIDSDVADMDGNRTINDADVVALRDYLTNDVAEFSGGTYVDTYACGSASKQDYYTDVDSTQIDAYVEELRDSGYAKQQDNAIGNNRYVTLTRGKELVHLTYLDYNQSLAVVKDEVNSTTNKAAVTKYQNVADTSLAVMSLNYNGEGRTDEATSANGESFVVTLNDGRYVIVDGGWQCDATALYNYLKDNNKRRDGKIEIAAWFLSHPHEDHYGAFVEFANTYHTKVSVEHVIAADGSSNMYSSGYSDWFTKTLPTYVTKFNAKLVRPHAGQILKFANAEFKMLYTAENYLNNEDGELLTSENNASLVFQMIADGKTVLFTNDSEKQVSELLVSIYGANLNSDIMQVNHHARSGAIEEFVEAINPTYSLWTTNQATYEKRTHIFAYVQGIGDQGVADLQSHQGMQYLLTLMGSNKERCLVADKDIEIIRLSDYNISYYTPMFTTE